MSAGKPPGRSRHGDDGEPEPFDDAGEPHPFKRWFSGDRSLPTRDWLVGLGADSDELASCLRRFEAGDASAREQLLTVAGQPMTVLVDFILPKLPGLNRRVETVDVVTEAMLGLWKRLGGTVAQQDPNRFAGLCAIEVHSRLLDLARKFGGPESSMGEHRPRRRPAGDAPRSTSGERGVPDAERRAFESLWRPVSEALANLPPRAAEAFMLVHLLGLTRRQAAEHLGVDRKTVEHDLALAQEAIDNARQSDGDRTTVEGDPPRVQDAIDDREEELETWRLIFRVLASQPARAALAFMLVHLTRLTRLQAAEQLDVDRGTVDRDLAGVTAAIDAVVMRPA